LPIAFFCENLRFGSAKICGKPFIFHADLNPGNRNLIFILSKKKIRQGIASRADFLTDQEKFIY